MFDLESIELDSSLQEKIWVYYDDETNFLWRYIDGQKLSQSKDSTPILVHQVYDTDSWIWENGVVPFDIEHNSVKVNESSAYLLLKHMSNSAIDIAKLLNVENIE